MLKLVMVRLVKVYNLSININIYLTFITFLFLNYNCQMSYDGKRLQFPIFPAHVNAGTAAEFKSLKLSKR